MCEVVGEAPASLVVLCLTSLALCLGYSCSPVCLLQAPSACCLYRNYHCCLVQDTSALCPHLGFTGFGISSLGLNELGSTGAIGIFLAGLRMLDQFLLRCKRQSKFSFLFSKSQVYFCVRFCKGLVLSCKMFAMTRYILVKVCRGQDSSFGSSRTMVLVLVICQG